MVSELKHVPVLLDPLLNYLKTRLPTGSTILDGTFGAGGYSRAFIDAGYRVIAFDCDPIAASFSETIKSTSFNFFQDNFSNLSSVMRQNSISNTQFDACVFDLGVSSMQVLSLAEKCIGSNN